MERQHNPIKVLTSGLEQQAPAPFFIGNKWRFTDRTRWWDTYKDDVPVVIGHYWRLFKFSPKASRFSQLFDDIDCHEWHGQKKMFFAWISRSELAGVNGTPKSSLLRIIFTWQRYAGQKIV
ncbi:hypothetical protein L1889_15090 [Paenalcaligenes niemegkensis]|uniref:hypothetical protein n=1 Tax=Paenalcaligenes niemegkensis TaxID=2895469 RepID=UPI001EE89000|nr:hypothetical protein [Paenalcaligenes niemegkensis]MCQ9617832.1 hypothetical protein [Paenalcaligenes niemegkensis]